MDAFYEVVKANAYVVAALPFIGYLSAVVTQKLKKWLSVQKDFTKILLNIAASALGACLLYLSQNVKAYPLVLMPYASLISTFALIAYHLPGIGVKAIAQQLEDGKAEQARRERVETDSAAVDLIDPTPVLASPGEFDG